MPWIQSTIYMKGTSFTDGGPHLPSWIRADLQIVCTTISTTNLLLIGNLMQSYPCSDMGANLCIRKQTDVQCVYCSYTQSFHGNGIN